MTPLRGAEAAAAPNRGGGACFSGRGGGPCRATARVAAPRRAPGGVSSQPRGARLGALRDADALSADGVSSTPLQAPTHAPAARRGWFTRRGGGEAAEAAPEAATPAATAPQPAPGSVEAPAQQRAARRWLLGGGADAAHAAAPSPQQPAAPPQPQPQPRPVDTWDASWPRRRTPVYVEPPPPPLLAWQRPQWLPEWADPGDPASDLRRWIFPFIVAPYLASQAVKLAFLGPALEAELHRPGSAFFHLTTEQVERYESEAERYRTHLGLEALMGRAPELDARGAAEAVRQRLSSLEAEGLEANCHALTDLLADGTFVLTAGVNVAARLPEVRRIRRIVGREFFALDSSRQAFVLLLLSDILVGYHSSEGWATALELLCRHYGLEERKDLVALFIAVVPVSLDVLFKFWCFKALRQLSPDTQVILDDIDRH